MADIIFNGESIELPLDFSIPYSIESSWRVNDLQADASYDFEIPYQSSARNKRIFRQLNLPAAIIQQTRFDIMLESGGVFRVAQLQFHKIDDYASVNVFFNGGSLSHIGDLSIKDIKFPVSGSLMNIYEAGTTLLWPQTAMYFPEISAPYFYDAENTDPADKVNPDWLDILNFRNQANTTFQDNPSDSQWINTLVPMPSLLHVLNEGLIAQGYRLAGNWMSNETIRRLFIFNNISLDTASGTPHFAFSGELADYLPDITLGKLLAMVVKGFVLNLSIDENRREVYLNRKLEQVALDSSIDLSSFFNGKLVPDFEELKPLLIQYQNKSSMVAIDINGKSLIRFGELESFSGDTLNLEFSPLPFPNDIKPGLSARFDTEYEAIDKIILGIAYSSGGKLIGGTDNGVLDLELSLLDNSLAADHIAWHSLTNADARVFRVKLLMELNTLARIHKNDLVNFLGTKCMVLKYEYDDTGHRLVEVEMALKRV